MSWITTPSPLSALEMMISSLSQRDFRASISPLLRFSLLCLGGSWFPDLRLLFTFRIYVLTVWWVSLGVQLLLLLCGSPSGSRNTFLRVIIVHVNVSILVAAGVVMPAVIEVVVRTGQVGLRVVACWSECRVVIVIVRVPVFSVSVACVLELQWFGSK